MGEWKAKGEKPNGEIVTNQFDTEDAAEERKEKAESDGLLSNIRIVPPQTTDGGGMDVDVVDHGPDATPTDTSLSPEEPSEGGEKLPERTESVDDPLAELGEELGTDPLSILPDHMKDNIQGTPAVNKRGYAMIAERYGIEASADIVTFPWENDEGRCVAKAVSITDDGKEYTGWATACSDDGDMTDQIIELAETRALKRSVSWASGVGIVSYQELQNEL